MWGTFLYQLDNCDIDIKLSAYDIHPCLALLQAMATIAQLLARDVYE
jgi:hypothetical protein